MADGPAGAPLVTVVLLNWNGRDDTLACLRSLELVSYPTLRVLVIDNGSADDSVAAIRAQRWRCAVELIETGRNLGFAGGNNVGLRAALAAGADFVLLLNNDTEVASDFIDELLAAAGAAPDAGVVGPWIYYHDRPDVLWFAGAEWSERVLAFTWPGQGQRAAEAVLRGDTAYVCGAAMMFRREALLKVGLLDERFFLVYEESDWCFRARRLGFGCAMAPRATVWHKIGASFGSEESPLRAYFSTRNLLLFAAHHLDPLARRRLLRRVLARLLPRPSLGDAGPPLVKRVWWGGGEFVADVRQRIANPMQRAGRRALLDYLWGRFGDCPPAVREWNRQWRG